MADVSPQEFGELKAQTHNNTRELQSLTEAVKELVAEMHEWRATFKVGKALVAMSVFLALFAGAGMKDAVGWLLKVVP